MFWVVFLFFSWKHYILWFFQCPKLILWQTKLKQCFYCIWIRLNRSEHVWIKTAAMYEASDFRRHVFHMFHEKYKILWLSKDLERILCQTKLKQCFYCICHTSEPIRGCLNRDCSNVWRIRFPMSFFDNLSCLACRFLFTQCITRHLTYIQTSAKYQCRREKYGDLIWIREFWVLIKSVMHFYEFAEVLKD